MSTTLGGLTTHMVGDLDRGGPVVVLLHGFGAPGTDLIALAEFMDAPPSTCFVFPEAPLAMPAMFGDSRAWWMIDLAKMEQDLAQGRVRDRSTEVPEGSDKPREMVIALLEELESKHGVTGDRVIIGGFSQGSMVACDVVLRSDRDFGGLIVWSGTMLAQDEWVPLMAKRKGLRVIQTHGESDPLLPHELAVMLRDHMREAGMIVDWQSFAGAHEIPPAALDLASGLVRKAAAKGKV